MFDKDSGLVKIWIRLLTHDNKYSKEDIPNISNLREIVLETLSETGE